MSTCRYDSGIGRPRRRPPSAPWQAESAPDRVERPATASAAAPPFRAPSRAAWRAAPRSGTGATRAGAAAPRPRSPSAGSPAASRCFPLQRSLGPLARRWFSPRSQSLFLQAPSDRSYRPARAPSAPPFPAGWGQRPARDRVAQRADQLADVPPRGVAGDDEAVDGCPISASYRSVSHRRSRSIAFPVPPREPVALRRPRSCRASPSRRRHPEHVRGALRGHRLDDAPPDPEDGVGAGDREPGARLARAPPTWSSSSPRRAHASATSR